MKQDETRQFDSVPTTPADLHDVERFVERTFESLIEEDWTTERGDRIFKASVRELSADRNVRTLRLAGSADDASLRQRIERVRDSDRIPIWRSALAVAAVLVAGVSISIVLSVRSGGEGSSAPKPIVSNDDALDRSEYLARNDLTEGVFDAEFDTDLDDLSADLDQFETDLASRPIEEASIYLATSEFDDWMDQFEEDLDTF